MKSVKHPKSLKTGIFCVFILFSIVLGAYWTYNPPAPTRVGDDPYSTSLKGLVDNSEMLEGQDVVISSTAEAVSWNATTDVLTFHVHDDYFGIDVIVMFENWTRSKAYPVSQLSNGSTVIVRGLCNLRSKGYFAGNEIHVILPDLVYLISITGLVAIIVLLLYYFKIDLKKLTITRKNQKTSPKKN